MKTAFIGHRKVFAKDISERLVAAIKEEIANGCTSFTMGTHGEFDEIALSVCRKLRREYGDLKIEVVITSLTAVKKQDEFDTAPYADVQTVKHEIDDVYYKRQITVINRYMIDECDTLISYVDTSAYRSGAKGALRYAEKRGLKIVNLYRAEDNPMCAMTQKQIDEYWKKQTVVLQKLQKH